MDFFGLTAYGASDPIKFYLRPDYDEPETPPNIIELINKGELKLPFNEAVRELDCYSGYIDGWAYGSQRRINTMRRRGFYKPISPSETYRIPITQAQDYGWWVTDEALKGESWYRPDVFIPKPAQEQTRFVNRVLLSDKMFIF